ncbi:hypothetical protein [Stenotrophomonas maltophilia]|uniref:hypothetical protein n=1 Tax=Stenotrophomonas maltophilia TaxID=40324 RepID=UPI0039C3ABEA
MYEIDVKQRHYKLPTWVVLAVHATRAVRSPVYLAHVLVLLVLAGVGIACGAPLLQLASLVMVGLVVTLVIVTADQMRSMIWSDEHLQYIACVVQTTKAGEWLARRYSTSAE